MKHIKTVLLALFLFFLPTQLGTYYFFEFSLIRGIRTDYLAPALFFTDILALVIFFYFWKTLLLFCKNRFLWIVLALLALTIPFASSPWISIYRYIKVIEWVALFGVFQTAVKDKSINWKFPLYAIFGSTILQFGLALAQFINKHSIDTVFYWIGERTMSVTTPDVAISQLNGNIFLRPYGSFSHPNSMAGYFLLLYFFMLTFEQFKQYKLVRNVAMFLSTLIILLSFSKGAIGTFVLLNISIFVGVIIANKCKFCGIARVFTLLIVAALFLVPQGDPLTITKRIGLIDNAIKIIITHPLVGTGLGGYLYAQSQFPNPYSSYFLQPVHNILLLFLAETGIVLGGAILFLVFKKTLPLLNNRPFLMMFLVVFLTGMLDHYWLTLQQNFLLAAVAFGLISGNAKDIIKPL